MSNLSNPKIILKGRIDITDNLEFVLDIIKEKYPNMMIINLDEYNNQIQGENVIQGAELLPPPGAVIAEAEGDMYTYDIIYESWYAEPNMQLYITAIISYLYTGKNLILYYPELSNNESITMPKLFDMFWKHYGIKFGIVSNNMQPQNPYYDFRSTPTWLNMMYCHRVIGVNEFLIQYPDDAKIQASEMMLLIEDIRPIESDPVKAILEYQHKLKMKPDLKRVIFKI